MKILGSKTHHCIYCEKDLNKKQISRRRKYCSQRCHGIHKSKYKYKNTICDQCGIPLSTDQKVRGAKYCSLSCAATKNNRMSTTATKNKRKETWNLKKLNGHVFKKRIHTSEHIHTSKKDVPTCVCVICKIAYSPKRRPTCTCNSPQCKSEYRKIGTSLFTDGVNLIEKICAICSSSFKSRKHSVRKTCSSRCRDELVRCKSAVQLNKSFGHKGWYKGIFCASTWELAYIIYCDDHKISFIRNTDRFPYVRNSDGKVHFYYPDFKEGSTYIEIKGYEDKNVQAKLHAVKAAGFSIELMRESDLEYVFNYVYEVYGKTKNKLRDLYDKELK